MSRNPICPLPFVTVRLSPNGGYWEGGKPVVLDPKAWVAHSAASGLGADPPARFYVPGPGATVTHFWFYGSGATIQMCRLDVPAWGNGALDRADGHNSPRVLVREWYRTGRNPNKDTISSEFTGSGVSGPAAYTQPTDAQMESFSRVTEWAISEGWLGPFNMENLLLHRDISATACPDGRYDVPWLLNQLEADEMTPEDRARMDALEQEIARLKSVTTGNGTEAYPTEWTLTFKRRKNGVRIGDGATLPAGTPFFPSGTKAGDPPIRLIGEDAIDFASQLGLSLAGYCDGLNTQVHLNMDAIGEIQAQLAQLDPNLDTAKLAALFTEMGARLAKLDRHTVPAVSKG